MIKLPDHDPKLIVTAGFYNALENRITELENAKPGSPQPQDILSKIAERLLAHSAEHSIPVEKIIHFGSRSYALMHEICWIYWYGDVDTATDAYGYEIRRNAKYDPDEPIYSYTWSTDHIFPFSAGGVTVVENGMPISFNANEEKGSHITGVANKRKFTVNRIETSIGPIGQLVIDNKIIAPHVTDLMRLLEDLEQ